MSHSIEGGGLLRRVLSRASNPGSLPVPAGATPILNFLNASDPVKSCMSCCPLALGWVTRQQALVTGGSAGEVLMFDPPADGTETREGLETHRPRITMLLMVRDDDRSW